MTKLRLVMLGLMVVLVPVSIAQAPVIAVRNLMTAGEFNAAGLNKLTPDELKSLDQWFARTLANFVQRVASGSSTAVPGTYPVEAAVNDETFIINGEVFKAKTYCFRVNKGDRVKFVEGSATGACASAKFLDLQTGETCPVWCE